MPRPSIEHAHELLRRTFRREIPGGNVIAAAAVRNALKGHEGDRQWIKSHFSQLVEEVQIAAYENYLEAESRAGATTLAEVLLPLAGRNPSAEDLMNVLGQYFHALDRFFLGLTQGRRPRAGKAFELLIRELFIHLQYPFSSQPVINGQPDFVLPSIDYFKKNPPGCIIFTVKRTLRERWRQIVTEGTRGLGFYLATIDENIASRDLEEMLKSRIHIVVPSRIKNIRKDFAKAPNVMTFEYFFEYHLDPAMKRWKAERVI